MAENGTFNSFAAGQSSRAHLGDLVSVRGMFRDVDRQVGSKIPYLLISPETQPQGMKYNANA